LRKSLFTVTSAALILGGLTGCGQGNNAASNRYYEETRPIGYYTSEHNPYVNNNRSRREVEERGNARLLEDNDGPLNEILDRSVIQDGKRVRRNNTATVRPTRNRTDNGGFMGIGYDNPRFSTTDKNYHGHLNGLERVGNPSYYSKYDGRTAEELAKRASEVKGVKDVRAIVNGDEILIAVEPEANANKREVRRDVRRAVESIAEGKELRVVVDQGIYSSVRGIDNDLRNGEYPLENLNRGLRGIYNTMVPGR
jgi:spore cortex protein